MEIEESIETKSNVLEHEMLQQVYDRIVGNCDKKSFPPIIPQLYYAINDIKTSNTNRDVDMDEESNQKAESKNIDIVTYDEEETGAEHIHTGTKNLESLTAPIRYRIKIGKKIFEDDFVKQNAADEEEQELYLNELLRKDVTTWALRISEMEQELKEKERKRDVVKDKIREILEN